jgi:hypothetical protein
MSFKSRESKRRAKYESEIAAASARRSYTRETDKRYFLCVVRHPTRCAARGCRLRKGDRMIYRVGYTDFGTYASAEFGVTPALARKRSAAGRALLVLEDAGRAKLYSGLWAQKVGTRGRRQLSNILGTYGREMMLAAFDKAVEIGPKGKPISDTILDKAMVLLDEERQAALPAPPSIAAITRPVDPDDDDDDEPEAVHVVYDRWDRVLDYMRDLRANVMDRTLRHRARQHLEEEITLLKSEIKALDDDEGQEATL